MKALSVSDFNIPYHLKQAIVSNLKQKFNSNKSSKGQFNPGAFVLQLGEGSGWETVVVNVEKTGDRVVDKEEFR